MSLFKSWFSLGFFPYMELDPVLGSSYTFFTGHLPVREEQKNNPSLDTEPGITWVWRSLSTLYSISLICVIKDVT